MGASEGLASWFHTIDTVALAEALKLRPDQKPLYAHAVGYPADR